MSDTGEITLDDGLTRECVEASSSATLLVSLSDEQAKMVADTIKENLLSGEFVEKLAKAIAKGI